MGEESPAASPPPLRELVDGNSAIFKDLTQAFISRTGDIEHDANVRPVTTTNPRLEDGKSLPPFWRKHFKPETMACKPLEEIDLAYGNETFVVLGKGGTIHRMSTSDSLFLLHPLNPLRKGAIYLTTHYMVSAFIVALVLCNVIFLTYEGYWFDYVCTAIYLLEFNLKVLSRGLVWGEFTCLRNPWNWLDILTILTSVVRPWNIQVFLVLQWFRLLKIVPLIKDMRETFGIILVSIGRLWSAMVLGLMSLSFLATFGLNIYMGVMTQRCIKNSEYHRLETDWSLLNKEFKEHSSNSSNWIPDLLCGNATRAGMCPNETTCHQGFGPNPDYGYTNFDSFLWSFLQAWRVMSQDYLEALMDQTMKTAGPGHAMYFPFVYLIGTFLIGSFANGLVAQYLERIYKQGQESYPEDKAVIDGQTLPVSQNADAGDDNASSTNWMKDNLKKIAEHFGFEVLITLAIVFDIFCFFCNMYNGAGFTHYNTLVVLVFYAAEFIIKVNGHGTEKYFKNRWSIFDFTILILIGIAVFASGSGLKSFGFLVSCIRLFKIVPRWTGLNNMLKIALGSLKQFCGIFGLASTFCILLALIGKESFGHFYKENAQLFPDSQIPRFNFVDFVHSFLEVFRSWCKETVESFWDCMLVAGIGCPVYFLCMQLLGILLVTIITISIVLLTMKMLAERNADQQESTLTKLCNAIFVNPITLVKQKLTPGKHHDQVKVIQRKDSEDAAGVGEGEDNGENRDPSSSKIAEHLRKLRNCLDSRPVLIASIVMIVFTSILLGFGRLSGPQHNDGPALIRNNIFYPSEIVFIVFFSCLIILKVVCAGVYSCLSSMAWIFDFVIVLEAVLQLSDLYYSFEYAYASLIFIRCLRPMMLVSRIERLEVVLLGIWETLKIGFTYFASVFYVWFFFAVIMNELYRYSLAGCVLPLSETQELSEHVKYTHDKDACLISNFTWQNPSHHFDDGAQSLMTTILLPSRNGWNNVLHSVFDATTIGGRAQKENNLVNSLTMFVPFYIFGVLFAASILIGVVANRLRQSPELFFTTESYKRYFELRMNCEEEDTSSSIPRPESGCRGKVFDLVNSRAFYGFTMFTMIFSFAILSVDSYSVVYNYFLDKVFNSLYFIVLLLIFVEITLKMIGLGKHFFSSGWNWWDLLTLILMVLGLMLSDLIEKYLISPVVCVLVRIFRLVKNPVFLSLFPKIKTLFKTFSLVKPALFNILMFHIIVMWCYAVFWGHVFGHLDHSTRPFSLPLIAMFLLSAFQGIDGIYLMLSNDSDCDIGEGANPGTCGHRGVATFFICSYLFFSILLTINFYLVLIMELVHQLNLKDAADDRCGDIELKNVPDRGTELESSEGGGLETVDIVGDA